ncbi:MAG: hypothetical protein FWE23_11240 [Chitinivibrionia bacterium]|nr:hypothetical protein [Chitinivibrionia bacterium]
MKTQALIKDKKGEQVAVHSDCYSQLDDKGYIDVLTIAGDDWVATYNPKYYSAE